MEAGQLFCSGCYGESYGATCRVEGVDQRLEETSCGWRLWISSGTLTASLALCVCVCSLDVCVLQQGIWIVDHVAHAIILYLERMCRVSLLELSDKQVDSCTTYQNKKR